MVSMRNSYANANDTITLLSIQMQMEMHWDIITAIVIMAYYDNISHDNDCGDANVCVSVRIFANSPFLTDELITMAPAEFINRCKNIGCPITFSPPFTDIRRKA